YEKNVASSAEASFDICIQNIFLPIKKLEIDNINVESVHIIWEAPLDDIDLLINSYFIEYCDLCRSQFVRCERFVDETLHHELDRNKLIFEIADVTRSTYQLQLLSTNNDGETSIQDYIIER
ncbi:unnamed protein product, partial [Rotaria sp. Silwood2]